MTAEWDALARLRRAALEHAMKCYVGPDDDTLPVLRGLLADLARAETPDETCAHGEREGGCASCAACAACDGSCGMCPYVARREAAEPSDDVIEAAWDAYREFDAAGLLATRSGGDSGTLFIEGNWLARDLGGCTCSPHMGAHERHCGVEPELDLSTVRGWRSEAEIKAEALREFADELRATACEGNDDWWHGYRQAQLEAEEAAVRRADSLAPPDRHDERAIQ